MDAGQPDRNPTLREQWEVHWSHQPRTRLDGRTNDRELVHFSGVCLLAGLHPHTKPATNGAAR